MHLEIRCHAFDRSRVLSAVIGHRVCARVELDQGSRLAASGAAIRN